jgi:hypothetical protein
LVGSTAKGAKDAKDVTTCFALTLRPLPSVEGTLANGVIPKSGDFGVRVLGRPGGGGLFMFGIRLVRCKLKVIRVSGVLWRCLVSRGETELVKDFFRFLQHGDIVHEMMHLLEPTHNETFIILMDKFMPQWRYLRDELNRAPLTHEERDY